MPHIGDWKIGGHTVRTTADTELFGLPPVAGLKARVEGWYQPPSFLIHADKITVGQLTGNMVGPIGSFPPDPYIGTWYIGGNPVEVDGDTDILGATPVVGLTALVYFWIAGGVITATSLDVRDVEDPSGQIKSTEFESIIQVVAP